MCIYNVIGPPSDNHHLTFLYLCYYRNRFLNFPALPVAFNFITPGMGRYIAIEVNCFVAIKRVYLIFFLTKMSVARPSLMKTTSMIP